VGCFQKSGYEFEQSAGEAYMPEKQIVIQLSELSSGCLRQEGKEWAILSFALTSRRR